VFFWLPASYHTPPVAMSAIFAGLLTKVGVYTLIRMYTLIFDQEFGVTGVLMLTAPG
jgi:multicomponent Na+:H+ antiporter subunit D